jgi:hypothetical protein
VGFGGQTNQLVDGLAMGLLNQLVRENWLPRLLQGAFGSVKYLDQLAIDLKATAELAEGEYMRATAGVVARCPRPVDQRAWAAGR